MLETQSSCTNFILPLDSDQAVLNLVGGKGANLAVLARAGFPVPGGFLLTTAAYRAFVDKNKLEERIQDLLAGLPENSAEDLEICSESIRGLFRQGSLPPDLAAALQAAYTQLGECPAAVRSSATAEDLPDLSFAGQQDTYLNVLGQENLRQAVIDCWSSLWTARAIGYRTRNQIEHAGVALAVVVQKMVESRASGVLFTANPLSGLRSEMVVDATLGLGEALVSGQVDPDHYGVDPTAGRIISKTIGAKALSIHGLENGGTFTVQEAGGQVQALEDELILELARMGKQVQDVYAFPQDIEWAEAGGALYILQSRPVTSLYPIPAGMAAEPVQVLFSFGAVQGILDPLTPVGQDALCQMAAMAAGLFGMRVTGRTQRALSTAGERLWLNLTTPLSNSVGRNLVRGAMGFVEPSIGQILRQIWDDPRLQPKTVGIRPQARMQIARLLLPMAANVFLNVLFPDLRRKIIVGGGERVLEETQKLCHELPTERHERLRQAADLLTQVGKIWLPSTLVKFLSGVASAMACWNGLNTLARQIPADENHPKEEDWGQLVLEVTRGMPHNPTTEMDLALWEIARAVRADPESFAVTSSLAPEALARCFLCGDLPGLLQERVSVFLSRFGLRGFVEIDLGRGRWDENPTHVFEMLTSFLQIEEVTQAPDAVFGRGAASAELAIERIAVGIRPTKRGWFKARAARFLGGRVRRLMGLREHPKFFAVRMIGIIRREILLCGQEFETAGELEQADDLFFLTFDEMKVFASGELENVRELIQARRGAYLREFRRKQIPRVLLSDGRAFYEGINQASAGQDALNGSPVSPGRAEGRVRVVLDPRQAHLQPGEILVCPGTDPSWTPLFLSAAGLVMEVGGMMTHGAVVAREYGIPAIVGVDQATTRLKTGQLVRIDGSSGAILMVEPDGQS